MRIFSVSLLAGLVSVLAAGQLQAQARAPATRKNTTAAEKPAPDMTRVRSWLESLHGDYTIEILPTTTAAPVNQLCTTSSAPGAPCTQYSEVRTPPTVASPRHEGTAECRPIGAGPGTQCLFRSNASGVPGAPVVVLFGLQADHPGIRVLSVDVMGVTRDAQALLTRYGVRLDTECPGSNCTRLLELEERKKGIVEITFMSGRGPDEIGAPFSNKRIVMQRSARQVDAPASMPSR